MKEMNMDEKRFSVGEVAKATGLTVRTLQHYDNIGLLPTSGRTESGRRYYTKNDILKLEQIVFYKSLGISLNDIKRKIIDSSAPKALEQVLSSHLDILLGKIASLHTAISMIEVSLGEIQAGNTLPWEALTHLIRTMEGSSLKDWTSYQFDSLLYESPEMKDITAVGAMDIYLPIRSLMVEAAMLRKVGRSPEDPSAQELAKRWWELILNMTGGDEAIISALTEVNKNREEWPEADRELYQVAEPYMEEALAIYISNNKISVPDALK
jgi:DNA-binding transcriptional MerR regulator